MAKRNLVIRNISLDGDTQPRAETDNKLIREYTAAYKDGAKMPPVVVFFDGKDHWLADGFHRWWAADGAGLEKIPCDIRKGTREDARWFSYSANQTHGMRRSNDDKSKAVKAALKHPKGVDMSDRQIAEHVGVDPMTVGKYRKELESTVELLQSPARTGRDGRTTNTANIGRRTPDTGEPEAPDSEEAPKWSDAQIEKASEALWKMVQGAVAEWLATVDAACEIDIVLTLREIAEEYAA